MYSATSGTAPAIPAIRALCTEAGVQIKPGNFGRFVQACIGKESVMAAIGHGQNKTGIHNSAAEPMQEQGHSHSHSHYGVAEHSHTHAGGHVHHRHVHTEEEMRPVINRLSRAIGHLESVKRMVERGEDCSEVLIQLAAVRNAINNTGKVIMKNHISHCIVEAIEENDMAAVDALNDAIDCFIK